MRGSITRPQHVPSATASCSPAQLVPSAPRRSAIRAIRSLAISGDRTSTSQPPFGPPRANTLLSPAETRASLTPAPRSRKAIRSTAYPLPMAPKFSSTPSRSNLTLTAAAIELHARQPDQLPRRDQRPLVWNLSVALEKSPAPAERSRRDVEGAVGHGMKPDTALDQREEFGPDCDRRRRREPVQPGHLGIVAEDAEHRLDPIRFVQRLAGRRLIGFVIARQRHLEPAGHRVAMYAEPRISGCGATAEVEREQFSTADRHFLLPRLRRGLLSARGAPPPAAASTRLAVPSLKLRRTRRSPGGGGRPSMELSRSRPMPTRDHPGIDAACATPA